MLGFCGLKAYAIDFGCDLILRSNCNPRLDSNYNPNLDSRYGSNILLENKKSLPWKTGAGVFGIRQWKCLSTVFVGGAHAKLPHLVNQFSVTQNSSGW